MMIVKRIAARTHPERRKGYAQIELTGENLSAEGFDFAIARTERGSKEYLAIDQAADAPDQIIYGWRADEGWVTPLDVVVADGRLFITLGPNVLRHMDQQSNYALTFRRDGVALGAERSAAWRDVAPVEGKSGGGALNAEPAVHVAAAAAQPVQPPPIVEKLTEAPPVPNIQSDSPPDANPLNRTSGDGSSSKRFIVVIVGALLASLAGWLLLSSQKQQNPAPTPPVASPLPPAAPAAPPLTTTPAAPAAANPLEEILKKPPEEIVAEAQRRRDRGQIAEAQVLLRSAGDQGSAEALRQLGLIFDPINASPAAPTPDRTNQAPVPDIAKAYTYYRQAIGKGSAEAKGDLARLRAAAEKLALQGDAKAEQLLRRWSE